MVVNIDSVSCYVGNALLSHTFSRNCHGCRCPSGVEVIPMGCCGKSLVQKLRCIFETVI